MGTYAKQVDFLLNGYRDPSTDEILSGGKVTTKLAGTSTLSALWTDREKTGAATNPIILGSDGTAEVFGDNVYDFYITDADDVAIDTISGVAYTIDVLASDITYNEGETGAVDRTIEERLQDLVSVIDFGAVGDGTTDDSAAFALAAATGDGIFIPRGSYNVPTGTFNATDFYTDGAVTILNNTTVVARSMSDKAVRFWSPDTSEIYELAANNDGTLTLEAIASVLKRMTIEDIDFMIKKETSGSSVIEPALFLRKDDDNPGAASPLGLAKIQWRMSNDGSVSNSGVAIHNIDGGRIDSVATDATEDNETARISISPQFEGNGESQSCASFSNGVVLQDGVNTQFFQGFGTMCAADSLWVNNTKVVDERVTGWTQAVGTADRATFNTASVTLPELAERVKALIEDLYAHGLIGN